MSEDDVADPEREAPEPTPRPKPVVRFTEKPNGIELSQEAIDGIVRAVKPSNDALKQLNRFAKDMSRPFRAIDIAANEYQFPAAAEHLEVPEIDWANTSSNRAARAAEEAADTMRRMEARYEQALADAKNGQKRASTGMWIGIAIGAAGLIWGIIATLL